MRTAMPSKVKKYFEPIEAEGLSTDYAPPYAEYANQCETEDEASLDEEEEEEDDES